MTGPHARAGNGQVAILDDDPSVRKALARVLRVEGLEVETFATPQEFLAAENRSRCLILDVHLGPTGTMTGLDLHDLLRSRANPPTVILMTAHDETSAEELARRVGNGNFLRKPFASEAFVQVVRRALAS